MRYRYIPVMGKIKNSDIICQGNAENGHAYIAGRDVKCYGWLWKTLGQFLKQTKNMQ